MNRRWLLDVKWRDSLPWGCLIGVVAVAIVAALRLLLIPLLYDRAAFLLFGLAVMISAWVGGRRVGLITTALATLVGLLLFIRMTPESNSLQNEVLLALFAIEGCGISFLAGQLVEQRVRANQEALKTTQALNELSDLIESIPDGFEAFDADFKLTFMNRATEIVLCRNAEQLHGTTVWEQFPAVSSDVERMLRRVMLERTSGVCESYYGRFRTLVFLSGKFVP